MIESYLLEYFNAVVEEKTILKASEKLHVSQPSVTKAMQKLEAELGIELFERKPNKITLNENGVIISEYIKDAISIDKRIHEKANELKRRALTTHIEMTAPGPTFKYANYFYFDKDKHPSTMEIKTEEECIKDITAGLCDVAFINSDIKIEGIHIEKVLVEKLYVGLPANHFLTKKKEGVTFAELDGQSFLIVRDLGIWNEVIDKHLKRSKFYRQDNSNIQDIITASNIPCFATNITMRLRSDPSRIFIPIADEDNSRTFYAICKEEKLKILEEIKKTS